MWPAEEGWRALVVVVPPAMWQVWRDREREKLARLAEAHAGQLDKLRSDFTQRAPYEAAIAGAAALLVQPGCPGC